jgi:hypothetical protein
MANRGAILTLVAAASFLAGMGIVLAQVPPHKPGTICIVNANFWCWAAQPGVPGKPCQCPTPSGPVAGKYG